MGNYLTYAIGVIIIAALSAIGSESIKIFFEGIKDKIMRRDKVNLSGMWHAAWQTTVEGKENINTEVLKIEQKGKRVIIENTQRSPENKVGGYLWRGECKFYDNAHLIGIYLAREPNVVAKGAVYFLFNRVGNFLIGQWIGCNIDSELTGGYGVIAKERDFALEKIQQLLEPIN
jgi:hypothetical protein